MGCNPTGRHSLANSNNFGAFFLQQRKVGRVTPCAPAVASQTITHTY